MPAYETHQGDDPFKIFLSGGSSDWRGEVKRMFRGYHVDLYDPFERSGQQSIMEFTKEDLDAAASSHLVLAFHDFDPVYGLVMESVAAYYSGVPVIYVTVQPRPISMMCGVARAVFTDMAKAVMFIIERFEIQTRRDVAQRSRRSSR